MTSGSILIRSELRQKPNKTKILWIFLFIYSFNKILWDYRNKSFVGKLFTNSSLKYYIQRGFSCVKINILCVMIFFFFLMWSFYFCSQFNNHDYEIIEYFWWYILFLAIARIPIFSFLPIRRFFLGFFFQFSPCHREILDFIAFHNRSS